MSPPGVGRADSVSVVLVEIYGDGGAVLSQRVRSDHRVRELQVSWAQYLEQQDHNVAIDVQRIQ